MMLRNVFSFVLLSAMVLAIASTAVAESVEGNKRATDTKTVTQFAGVIDDLPLMPGLTPQDDKDVLFTSGDARIAQTTATGSVDIEDVYQFYRKSLPQLGWKYVNERTYERDNEKLRIDVKGSDALATTVVRFSVEPISAKN